MWFDAIRTPATGRARSLYLALLVVLGLGFAVSLLDPHALEYDPWHTHVVVGGTAEERAKALAAHTHSRDRQHQAAQPSSEKPLNDERYEHEAEAQVVSLRSPNALGVFISGLTVLALLGICLPRLVPNDLGRLPRPAQSTPLLAIPFAPPEPPPRY